MNDTSLIQKSVVLLIMSDILPTSMLPHKLTKVKWAVVKFFLNKYKKSYTPSKSKIVICESLLHQWLDQNAFFGFQGQWLFCRTLNFQ